MWLGGLLLFPFYSLLTWFSPEISILQVVADTSQGFPKTLSDVLKWLRVGEFCTHNPPSRLQLRSGPLNPPLDLSRLLILRFQNPTRDSGLDVKLTSQ